MLLGIQGIALRYVHQRHHRGGGEEVEILGARLCTQLKLSWYKFYLDCSKLRVKILSIIIRRTTKKITIQ